MKILGTGCAKCQQMMQIVEEVVSINNLDVSIEKVEDMEEIMEMNIMVTPALVIDGSVVLSGRLPSKQEVLDYLRT